MFVLVCVFIDSLSVRLRMISEKCDVVFGLPPLHTLFYGVLLKCRDDDIVILFSCTVWN